MNNGAPRFPASVTQWTGLLLLMLLTAGCGSTEPLRDAAVIQRNAVPLQYGYGGNIRTEIIIDDHAWNTILDHFQPPAHSALEERRQIAEAVGAFERIAGDQTPIRYDLARNTGSSQGAGMADCLDESANTTTWLLLLQQHDILKFHVVMKRVFRAPKLFDAHYSAAVRDRSTGTIYVIDSWFRDHGEPAVVQNWESWKRKDPLPSDVE